MPGSDLPPALQVAKRLIDTAQRFPFGCPNCGKQLPIEATEVGEIIMQEGVALSRQDNSTALCSDCGVKEAFGHPVKLVGEGHRYSFRTGFAFTDGQVRLPWTAHR